MALADIVHAAAFCGISAFTGMARAIRDAAEFDRIMTEVARVTGADHQVMVEEARQLAMTTEMSPLQAAWKVADERRQRWCSRPPGAQPSEPWPRK